jgi:hypothetical protein
MVEIHKNGGPGPDSSLQALIEQHDGLLERLCTQNAGWPRLVATGAAQPQAAFGYRFNASCRRVAPVDEPQPWGGPVACNLGGAAAGWHRLMSLSTEGGPVACNLGGAAARDHGLSLVAGGNC